MSVQIAINQKLESPNTSTCWQRKHLQDKHLKRAIYAYLYPYGDIALPCVVTLKRYGKREMDYDNLVTAFKPVRDAVADYLIPGLAPGRADADKRITWRYLQEKGRTYSIGVTIDPLDTSCEPEDRSQAKSGQ